MWNCLKCGEPIEDQFDSCWKCGTAKAALPAQPSPAPAVAPKPGWRLVYKYFRGTFATWEELFNDASAFATGVGPERVVGISHSADRGDGVVNVWYWTEADAPATA
jgi:hypothetical protein